ncbi:Aldo/keto reductase [Niveomyces insectorum RCEF 264]|uniref:Aldo/keto reductase n=1 Tax=Niveomyces insectorum RCEF 264 TaxID=1081102 RepID=A0A162IB01_9HYPO|nr:Aldo/keto reductase [Niveomyces insectorum RCEF 264]
MATGLQLYKGKTHTLNTGQIIPAIGLGTFQDPDEQEQSVYIALKNGYRHIDTAHNYGTEKQVAQGIRRSGVPRDQIFLTTKLWCNAHHPDDVKPALDESLRDLETAYVDLYLMHYPCAFKRGPDFLPFGLDGKMVTDPTPFIDTWKAMEKLLKTGKTRAIGVSNFSKSELEVILKEGSIVPAAHQMELHPYLQQKDFIEWHKEKGIRVIQFSPCGNLNPFYRAVSWSKTEANMTRLVDHPVLAKVAQKHGKTPIQIALAWGVVNGRAVIPKSTIEWQILENADADKIALDEDDLRQIATMDQKARFNDPSADFGYQLYIGLDGAAA